MEATVYNLTKTALSLILVVALGFRSFAQNVKKADAEPDANIKSMIDAQRYIFKAQTVHPSRGRMVQLNSDYDLRVTGDTVRSYLPYFGRAYSAPIGERSGGFDFTSRNFDYEQRARRKGGWDISIRPKDVNDVRELLLTVFENGSASLRVTSNNREPISFNGFVQEE